MKNRLNDKWLYFPVILFFIYFAYRIIDFSKIAYRFPLEKTNDIASYIAQLYFLVNYGFHGFVPNWGDGFILFQTYPPGWFYFTLPLYYLLKDYLVATFVSLILMIIIIFLVIFYFGRLNNLSLIRRLAFFIFLLANPIAIGNFLRVGRVTELFGWMNFIILAFLLLYYLNKKLDIKFYSIFIVIYAILMLSHPAIMVVFLILLIGFFFSRKLWKEKFFLIISSVIVYIISSFWWIDFILNIEKDSNIITYGLLSFNNIWFWTNFAGIVIVLILWFSFYLYWKNFRNKTHLIFFLPILIVSFLFISRIIIFVPVLKNVYPDVFIFMFLFFSLYYFLNVRNYRFTNLIGISLMVLSIASVLVSIQHTPLMREYSNIEYDAIKILEEVEGKLFVFGFPGSGFTEQGGWLPGNNLDVYAFYSYSAACCNLNSATHVMFSGSSSVREREFFFETMRLGHEGKCEEFSKNLESLEVEEFITFQDHCDTMLECGFKLKERKDNACLFFS